MVRPDARTHSTANCSTSRSDQDHALLAGSWRSDYAPYDHRLAIGDAERGLHCSVSVGDCVQLRLRRFADDHALLGGANRESSMLSPWFCASAPTRGVKERILPTSSWRRRGIGPPGSRGANDPWFLCRQICTRAGWLLNVVSCATRIVVICCRKSSTSAGVAGVCRGCGLFRLADRQDGCPRSSHGHLPDNHFQTNHRRGVVQFGHQFPHFFHGIGLTANHQAVADHLGHDHHAPRPNLFSFVGLPLGGEIRISLGGKQSANRAGNIRSGSMVQTEHHPCVPALSVLFRHHGDRFHGDGDSAALGKRDVAGMAFSAGKVKRGGIRRRPVA